MREYLPDINYFIGKQVPGQSGEYIIEEHRGSGANAHVFRAHSDDLTNDIAVKIVPRQNLKPNWKQEFQKANILRSQIVVNFFSVNEWKDQEHMIDCVVLLSNFIYGRNLREHIKQEKNNVSIKELKEIPARAEIFFNLKEKFNEYFSYGRGRVFRLNYGAGTFKRRV